MKNDNFYSSDRIDLELLINYVENSVTEDTRQSIHQYLNENEAERLVIEGIRTYYRQYGMDREAMLGYLQNTRDTSLIAFKERTTKRRTMPQWIGWAAALLVICLSIVTYLFIGENNSYQSNLTSYLSEPYPVTVFLSNQSADAWVEAYQSGDYQQSSALLDKLIQEPQDNSTLLLYYAGLSHLYQQPPQPEPAIKYLSQVNDGAYAQQAHWYLALAYLLNEQTDDAESLLENIVATQTFHHEEAAELLEHISQE